MPWFACHPLRNLLGRSSLLFCVSGALALCLSMLPLHLEVAAAATTCTGALSQFDGINPISPGSTGTTAVVSVQIPSLCTTNDTNSDSSTWVMLTSNGAQYAQVGYGRHQGETTAYHFTEYSIPNQPDFFAETAQVTSALSLQFPGGSRSEA